MEELLTIQEIIGYRYCKQKETVHDLTKALCEHYDLSPCDIVGDHYREFFEGIYVQLLNAGYIPIERKSIAEHILYKLRIYPNQCAMFTDAISQVKLPAVLKMSFNERYNRYMKPCAL